MHPTAAGSLYIYLCHTCVCYAGDAPDSGVALQALLFSRQVLGGIDAPAELLLNSLSFSLPLPPQAMHLIQAVRSKRFCLFDYGSAAANRQHYCSPAPPDIAQEYWRLDVPVDLVAGSCDGVIPPVNVRKHYDRMVEAGVRVTYVAAVCCAQLMISYCRLYV